MKNNVIIENNESKSRKIIIEPAELLKEGLSCLLVTKSNEIHFYLKIPFF